MGEAVQVVKSSKNLKPFTARKRKAPPFSDKIPLIKSLILDSVEPGTIKKIYLFGSYAYGKPTSKSDIDLCVVIGDESSEIKTEIKLQIALALFDNKIIPADVIVYTEEQFTNVKNPNGIKNTIMNQGIVVYE